MNKFLSIKNKIILKLFMWYKNIIFGIKHNILLFIIYNLKSYYNVGGPKGF